MTKAAFIHQTSIIDENVNIGNNSKVWHWSHVSSGVKIGINCVIGQNVFIGEGVTMGNNVKIQNNVSIFSGVKIENNVFCGPSCVFLVLKTLNLFLPKGGKYEITLVKANSTIGANSTIICELLLDFIVLLVLVQLLQRMSKNHSLVVGNPAKHMVG